MLSDGIHPLVAVLVGVSGVPPVDRYIRIIDLAPGSRQSLQSKIVRGKVLIRHGLVVVISLICRDRSRLAQSYKWIGRASLDCVELYFYYKTGCQVLLVKKHGECSESAVLRIGITSGSDGGSPTAASQETLSGVAWRATSQKA